MPQFDSSEAECLVFTFKEGLLSPLAHDLVIRVGRFTVEVEPEGPRVTARFEADSLHTLGAADPEGNLAAGLTEADCQTVDGNVRRSVLRADTHPVIRFESSRARRTAGGWALEGCLCMNDHRQEIEVAVTDTGERLVGEARVDQRAFGIRPYTGLMGTMRIKPEVRVRVSLPRVEVPEAA